MKREKNRSSTIGLLVLAAVMVLFFYSPLISSEGKETEKSGLPEDQVSAEGVATLKGNSNDTSDFLQVAAERYKSFAENLSLDSKQYKPNNVFKNVPSLHVKSQGGLENTLFTTTLVTLAGLNAMDFYTTNQALKYEGLQEANPLMKPFTKNTYTFAAVKLGLSTLSFYGLKRLHKKNKTMAWILSIASNVVVGYVVYNNAKWIQRAQK